MNAGSIPARTSMIGYMHPAPVDRLAQRRRYGRTGRLSIAAAILLHLLAITALVLVIREQPPQPQAAPSEVALLFDGGLRQASPLPPTENPSQAPLPSQTPGVDTQDSASSSPPPPPAEVSPPIPTPALPVPPVPPSEVPPTAEPPVPEATAPETVSPAPSTAEVPNATTAPPDVTGTAPPPPAVASREPPAVAARPPVTRPSPPRPQSRPVVRSYRPSQPRFTADGFPTTLFGSTDFSGHASVTRHAALGAPPTPAGKSSQASDIHGAEDLGSDWMSEFSAYVERHKRYPEQAAENNDEGDTTVQIVVNRDGHVDGRDVDLVGRSGSQWLDLGLMAMFRGARLPPFPPGAPHDRETVTVTMHYYLIR